MSDLRKLVIATTILVNVQMVGGCDSTEINQNKPEANQWDNGFHLVGALIKDHLGELQSEVRYFVSDDGRSISQKGFLDISPYLPAASLNFVFPVSCYASVNFDESGNATVVDTDNESCEVVVLPNNIVSTADLSWGFTVDSESGVVHSLTAGGCSTEFIYSDDGVLIEATDGGEGCEVGKHLSYHYDEHQRLDEIRLDVREFQSGDGYGVTTSSLVYRFSELDSPTINVRVLAAAAGESSSFTLINDISVTLSGTQISSVDTMDNSGQITERVELTYDVNLNPVVVTWYNASGDTIESIEYQYSPNTTPMTNLGLMLYSPQFLLMQN